MNIGFDAKRFFHNNSGLGNYSRTLVKQISTYFPHNNYFLYNTKPSNRTVKLESNTKEILPKSIINQTFPSFWRSKNIVKQLLEDKLDIYHGLSHELPIGIENTNIKSVVTIHDLIFLRYPEYYKSIDRKIYQSKIKSACERANKIIAISEQTKRDIVDFLNINPLKIDVIYQGCADIFKKALPKNHFSTIRNKYSLPAKYILSVGTIEERKNTINLIKAFRLETDHDLVIVGGAHKNYLKEVKRLISEFKLNDRVHILSGVTDNELVSIYQNATIFVYASLFEGFGIPIIEAIHSKIPVIAATGSCLEEAGGNDCIYVDPLSPDQLASSINMLLNNSDKRNEMIEKSLLYVQKFEDEIIADQVMKTYLSIFENK